MKGSNRSCKNTDGYDRRNLVDNQPPEFLETFIHKFIAYKNCVQQLVSPHLFSKQLKVDIIPWMPGTAGSKTGKIPRNLIVLVQQDKLHCLSGKFSMRTIAIFLFFLCTQVFSQISGSST